MADTAVTWRGMTFGGGGDYHVEEITGWDDLPEITSYDEPRTRGHGDHVGDQFSRSRIVTIAGSVASPAARDALALAMMSASPVSSAVEDLTVETFGRSLTAGARLIRRALPVGENYAAGVVPFALQWKCPDPLRYGPAATSSTGLPTPGGGMVYPITYGLTYGTPGTPGQLVVSNPGTADTSIVFTVSGPLPFGFELAAGEQRLTYAAEVFAGQPVTVDTGAGLVSVENGTADRRANLLNGDWIQVPAGQSLTVAFSSLGGPYDPAASLTATVRPAYW